MTLFAAHIVGARTLLGMSQMDLALASGVSQYAITRLEKAEGPIGNDPATGPVTSLIESRGIIMAASETTIAVSIGGQNV